MTVIAWDGQTLAADTQMTRGDVRTMGHAKIKEFEDYVYAITGDAVHFDPLIAWHRDGCIVADYPGECKETSTLIVVDRRTRECVSYIGCPYAWSTEGVNAWGCGMVMALGAMYAGAPAVEAVQICIDHCDGVGGTVMSVTVSGPKPRRKKA
jgi:hypothetical protein